jgi:hypothetical protein
LIAPIENPVKSGSNAWEYIPTSGGRQKPKYPQEGRKAKIRFDLPYDQ